MGLLLWLLDLLWLVCLPGDLRDCRDDIGVGPTPAKIAAHALADLVVVKGDMVRCQIGAHRARPTGLSLAQHANCRANLP